MPARTPWLPSAEELRPFYRGVDAFVEAHITPNPRSIDTSSKVIVDPIVGYVHFQPWELALLDTDLLQRLRGIRQLDLAHLVFPTLGYSRFEHTIGVFGNLLKVLDKLRDTHRRLNDGYQLEEALRQHELSARLAALFHDAGHCLFSHVSERVLNALPGHNSYPSASTIRNAFQKHFDARADITIAEVLSLALLGSPATATFIQTLDIPATEARRIPTCIETAAHLIVGMPGVMEGAPRLRDPKTVFLAQLLSSGLDIDKLDYMAREAHLSGIRLELDFNRILDKLRGFELSPSALPGDLRSFKKLFKGDDSVLVLGLARGGQFVFEELCISRMALYEKIYLHPKIRAARAQLASLLFRIPERVKPFEELHRWLYLSESHLLHPDAPIPGLEHDLFSQGVTFAEIPFRNLFRRHLLHRAFAFGPANSLSDPAPASSQEPGSVLSNKLVPSARALELAGKDPVSLQNMIRDRMTAIADLLSKTAPVLTDEIIVDVPGYLSVQQGHGSVYFEHPAELPRRWTMPIDKLVDYYHANRALAYVFAPPELVPLALLAAEVVLWEEYACTFVQTEAIKPGYVKIADADRRTLHGLGFYAAARELQPISENLRSAESQEQLRAIETCLESFESYRGERVTMSRLTAYVSQFPEGIQAALLECLSKLTIVDERHLKETLNRALRSLPRAANERRALVPLGGLHDSAGRLGYTLRDLTEDGDINRLELLSDEVVKRITRLVCFDDNVNTGKQALNIFASWFDHNLPPELGLREEHVQPLGTDSREKLREIPIVLVFSVGVEGAEARLAELLETYLQIPHSNVEVHVGHVLKKNQRPFSGPDTPLRHPDRRELRQFLANTGRQLMLSENASPDTAASRELGYGGAEALVAFPYNVPTMTLTALWCRGTIGGVEWMPLMERRRRKTIAGEFAREEY